MEVVRKPEKGTPRVYIRFTDPAQKQSRAITVYGETLAAVVDAFHRSLLAAQSGGQKPLLN